MHTNEVPAHSHALEEHTRQRYTRTAQATKPSSYPLEARAVCRSVAQRSHMPERMRDISALDTASPSDAYPIGCVPSGAMPVRPHT